MHPNHLRQAPDSKEVIGAITRQLNADQRLVISTYLRCDESAKAAIYARHQGLLDWLQSTLWHNSLGDRQYCNELWQELARDFSDPSDFEKTQNRLHPSSGIQGLKPGTPEDLVRYLTQDERHELYLRLSGQQASSADLDFRIEQIGGYTSDNRKRLRVALGMSPDSEHPSLRMQPKVSNPGIQQPKIAPFSQRSPHVQPHLSPWSDPRPSAENAQRIRISLPKNSLELRLLDHIQTLSTVQWRALVASFRDDKVSHQDLHTEGVTSNDLLQAAQEIRHLQGHWSCSSEQLKEALKNLQGRFSGVSH